MWMTMLINDSALWDNDSFLKQKYNIILKVTGLAKFSRNQETDFLRDMM